MLGLSSKKETKPFFLYSSPFIIEASPSSLPDAFYEYLGDTERSDLEKIYSTLARFAIQEKLISVKPDTDDLELSKSGDGGSWIWLINHSNFRSLLDMREYGSLMTALQTRNAYPLSRIIEVHGRLGMLYDQKILNTLVNRVMQSIQIIPLPQDPKYEYTTWSRIHMETPFVWMIILLHNVIRSSVKKFDV